MVVLALICYDGIFLFYRMHEKISDFLWQLLYLVNKRQIPKTEELTEGMFQDLFIRFARIFGLNLM